MKNNQSSHTPTPWYFDFEKSYGANHGPEWETRSAPAGRGIWTAHCQSGHDAAFIVKAVNCHEELVEALKSVKESLLDIHRDDTLDGCLMVIEDALARGEGKDS